MIDLKNALLDKGDFNVILVDWSQGANQDYGQSAGNTRLNGAIVAHFINFLIYHSGNSGQSAADKFYFIGFSFGAQIGGFAGRRLQEKYGMELGRITGKNHCVHLFICLFTDMTLCQLCMIPNIRRAQLWEDQWLILINQSRTFNEIHLFIPILPLVNNIYTYTK